MVAAPLVIGVAFAYLLLLFAVATYGDRRAAAGRSVIGNAWVYALSMAVYCSAWTYFGSVGRAAGGGVWFLPIYLGPMLAMILAWMLLRKMIRIARAYRITSIADFIASRYGKSQALAGLVTLITVVGLVPYIALQLKGIAVAYALMTQAPGVPRAVPRRGGPTARCTWRWRWPASPSSSARATSTAPSATKAWSRPSPSSRWSSCWPSWRSAPSWSGACSTASADLFAKAQAVPDLARLLTLGQGKTFAYEQWFALTMLSALSLIFLPRQFQVMVVENVDERHLKRAAWAFPLYLLLINLFVLPIALAGLLRFGVGANAEGFVLTLPLAAGHEGLALLAFVGGLSAATGMVIVEAIAVSTMVCNDLVMPMLLRTRRFQAAAGSDLTGFLLGIRRAAIVAILLLGYLYYRLAGEAYALVGIGLISFAAVAQFAPAMLGGMYWKGGTRAGALAGLGAGFALWIYTLLLPSFAKSGWLGRDFLAHGAFGLELLRPEALLGLKGLDYLTHSLFWSLLANAGLYVTVSLWRAPSARETSQALLFVDVFRRTATTGPVFWRGRAHVADLLPLLGRFLGLGRAQALFDDYARRQGVADRHALQPDAQLVQFVETQLAGAIGSASARVMVASVVEEESLGLDDVMRILDEASQLRAYSHQLEQVTDELKRANEQLKSLDRLKDDFMSSVTHELRTPLTSIRALAEVMRDDAEMPAEQRQEFLGIVVAETERLSRLVNQVLDMAKIESGHAEWHNSDIDLRALLTQAVHTTEAMFRERGASVVMQLPGSVPLLRADADRLMQVLLNLLSNAAKFVPQGAGRVELRLDADAAGVTVSVHDNGAGVPAEQRALIFEKFRQGGDALNRPQGTGLGLPISRQIVEHFGGRMGLRDDTEQGACFFFTLPWRPKQTGDKT